MDTSYLPVAWEYKEMIQEAKEKETRGRIFYFCEEENICSKDGQIAKMDDVKGKGVFIQLDTGDMIRVDRIITLFGKPGAAYDEYDAYANACLSCFGDHGGDDL